MGMRDRIVVRATQAQLETAARIADDAKITRPDAIRMAVRRGIQAMYGMNSGTELSDFIERGSNPTQMWFDRDVYDDIEVMLERFPGNTKSTIVRAALEIGAKEYGKSWTAPKEHG